MAGSDPPPDRVPDLSPPSEWEETDTITGTGKLKARWAEVVAKTSEPPDVPIFKAPLQAGRKVGRYTLVTRLAKGGMAFVWMAWRRRSTGKQEVIALKTLLPSLSHDQGFVHMFLDEAKLLSEIRHPNVVSIRNVGVYGDIPYVALEWVEGDTLSALLRALNAKGKEVPMAIALRIIGECCLGLHQAHELRDARGEHLNVVHRDVSPSNIMLSSHGDVKLIDFGVAKASERLAEVTRTGVLKGKVSYMAPEQVLRATPDRRTDIWAVGVVLYRLIAQRLPYEGDIPSIVRQIKYGEPVPPLPAGTPRPVAVIVYRALAREPQDRFQTAAEMRRAVQYAYAEVCAPVPKDQFARFVMTFLGTTIQARRESLARALQETKPGA
ncbi:MAG TPA: serine/threonine-protein kinase [Polyangiaceae bacterium]|nr:serine/threonine-protein kinase [Polyangiaceae bacterium]